MRHQNETIVPVGLAPESDFQRRLVFTGLLPAARYKRPEIRVELDLENLKVRKAAFKGDEMLIQLRGTLSKRYSSSEQTYESWVVCELNHDYVNLIQNKMKTDLTYLIPAASH